MAGVGVLTAGFGPGVNRREHDETSQEAFYRLRLTHWTSLKPDVQYIFHPNGGGTVGSPLIKGAPAFDIRLEMAI